MKKYKDILFSYSSSSRAVVVTRASVISLRYQQISQSIENQSLQKVLPPLVPDDKLFYPTGINPQNHLPTPPTSEKVVIIKFVCLFVRLLLLSSNRPLWSLKSLHHLFILNTFSNCSGWRDDISSVSVAWMHEFSPYLRCLPPVITSISDGCHRWDSISTSYLSNTRPSPLTPSSSPSRTSDPTLRWLRSNQWISHSSLILPFPIQFSFSFSRLFPYSRYSDPSLRPSLW